MSGFITKIDLHNAITSDLGIPIDVQVQAYEGIISDENGKVNLQKLKRSIMQNQNGQQQQTMEKFKQQIQKQFNSQENVLQYFMSGWDRIPRDTFCQKIIQQHLLNDFEAKEVANIIDKDQTNFIYQTQFQTIVLSQIPLQTYNQQAIVGVKQIESPKASVAQFQRIQSLEFQAQQPPQQNNQFTFQMQPQVIQQQQPLQSQQFGNQVTSQYPQYPQQPVQQQASQYPQQYPPQYLPQQQQPQQQFPQQQYPEQLPFQPPQQPQFQPPYQVPPPYIQPQQNLPQQFPQQNNISWQNQQPQQFGQMNPNDLTKLKQLIDSLTDHAYELKILLKDQDIHEFQIQVELQKLEGKQFIQIQDVRQLSQLTNALKPNDSINLPKLLDNCKIIREKNYKIEKDQFNQDNLIIEVKEKINNYIKGQQISFRTFFRQIAINNDQQMEHKEFQTGLKKKLGLTLDDRQVIQLFKQIDQNGDFQLSYEEFQNFMQGEEKIEIKPILRKIRKKILRKDGENLHEVFDKIDINKDRRINFQEWQQAMNSLDLQLTFDEISAVYKHFDKNDEGINYELFETILLEDHMSLKQWAKQIESYCLVNSLTQDNMFRRFNQQGNNLMSFKEFKLLLKAVDANAVNAFDDEQYEDIFNIFDSDKDYQISLTEFQKMLNLQKSKGMTESTNQSLSRLFQRVRRKAMNQRTNLYWELKQYDYNNFNKVKFEDWSRVIKRFCDLAPSELEILFKSFDKLDSNSLDINEFIAQIQNTGITDDINTLIDKITDYQKKFNLSMEAFWNKFNKSPGQNWKFEEFNKMMEQMLFDCQQEEKDEYFQNFDLDNDNQISLADLQSAMRRNLRMKMNFDMYANPYQNQPPQQYPNQSQYPNQQFPNQQQQQYPNQQQQQYPNQQQQQQYPQKFPSPEPYQNILPQVVATEFQPAGQFNVDQVAIRVIDELQQVHQQTNRNIFQVFTDYDFKRNFSISTSAELENIIKGLARMNFQFSKQDADALFFKFSKNNGQSMHFGQILSDALGVKIFVTQGLKYLLEKQMISLNQIIPPQGLTFEQFQNLIIQYLQIIVNQFDLRQVFDSMDFNRNGLLRQEELVRALQLETPGASSPQQLVQSIKREILNSYRSMQMTETQLFEIFFSSDQQKQFSFTTQNELKLVLTKLKINKPDQDINAFYKFYSREYSQVNYLKVYSDLFNSELALRMAMLKIIEFQKLNAEKLFKNISSGNNFMTYDQFFTFCERIKMELTRSEANAIYQENVNKQTAKFSLKEFQVFLSMGGQNLNQGFVAGQMQDQMFEENMFINEKPMLTLIAKEMQQNKNILTVADLFKTKDKFVPKQTYFNTILWLGFNQNDPQILSIAKKLSNPNDFTQIQSDWFEQALRRLGNLGQHMQQQFGANKQQQKQDFNWEEQNFLNSLTEEMKDTADEIAEAVVEDNVGMFAFQKYDPQNTGKITQRQLDQIVYTDLHFQTDQYLNKLIQILGQNNSVDLKLLEKVLNNKGTLNKLQQKQNQPTVEMYGVGRFNQAPTRKLTTQEMQQAQQLVELIKNKCKNEEQINDYFFPLGSPSAINLTVFTDKIQGISAQVNLKQPEIELLFNYLDVSSNGILTSQEFKLIFETQYTKKNAHNIKISGRLQDEIRQLFQKLDENNNNTLEQGEISQALQSLGICPNPTELQEYFRKIDLDHNGLIDYTEFSSFMIQKLKEEMLSIEEFQSNIRREFKRVDVNKTRLLSRSQMDTLFRNLGYELDKQELEVLFQEIDKDQSGQIDIDELLYFLCSNKQDISETAKMAILNINCAHISLNDLAATFQKLPATFIHSFLRKLNKQGSNLPASSLKLQLDNTKLYYKDLVYDLPPGMQQYIPGTQPIGKPVLRRITDTEWFEIKINSLTGIPLPDQKNLVLGRELKFCLMDNINNFVAGTAKMKAYWTQQYEDRWYFQPQGIAPQSIPFYEVSLKEENSLIVRIQNQQLDRISKLIIELIIYVKNQDKVIAVSCGWVEVVIKDVLNQNRTTFEMPVQSGMPANSKVLSNVKVERKGWSKLVQKLKSPIKSQIAFEIARSTKFPPDYKDMVNCLPPTIILNKVHLNYFAIYREYIAKECLDPQYGRGSLTLHKSSKVRAFLLGVNSMDFVELVTRFWLKLESGQQFRDLAKQSEDLFRLKMKCFEIIQDQAYLLINNLGFKYNFADPTYPTHYDVIARNRNPLYNDFMQTVTMRLQPSRSGQVPVKKEWYNNLEPFNTAQLSDDEEDNILLQKFKQNAQKGKKNVGMSQTYQGQLAQNQQQFGGGSGLMQAQQFGGAGGYNQNQQQFEGAGGFNQQFGGTGGFNQNTGRYNQNQQIY